MHENRRASTIISLLLSKHLNVLINFTSNLNPILLKISAVEVLHPGAAQNTRGKDDSFISWFGSIVTDVMSW